MTEDQKKLIAMTFITALQTRNPVQLRCVLTEDSVWSIPGSSAVSGEAAGASAVISKAEYLGSNGVHFELLHVLYGWKDVAVSLHNTAQRGDRILDEYLTSILRLRDGKIERIDTYISDVPMLNRFAASSDHAHA